MGQNGTNRLMTVSIREKISNDKKHAHLYLDIYSVKLNPKRKKESLKMHVFVAPKTTKDREHNRKTYQLAESIKSKKLLELQHVGHGFAHLNETNQNINFIEYFQEQTNKRYESTGNYGNWDSSLKHLIKNKGQIVPIKDINTDWVNGFKNYLLNEARSKSNKPLSQNSCHSYFNKLKACLNQARRDGLINHNVNLDVTGIKVGETNREYLTLEELKAISKVDCAIPILKSAFIFSALTGLRWSDVNNLKWSDLQHSEAQGWFIRFQQKKTRGFETLPISEQARSLMGEISDPDERVFIGLKYSAWYNLKLQQWVIEAGISKTITFHCARHTFATLQLTLGTDIYTVSKLLGHKELKTTQVYAKIIDSKKHEAANKIPDLDL